MKKKNAGKSKSGEFTQCSLIKKVEPRHSAGKTSIVPEPAQSLDQFSYNMYKLATAREILTPLIDEIISSATSYSAKDLENILEKRSPICTITKGQFNMAKRASEIVEQVKSDLEITEILPFLDHIQILYNTNIEYQNDPIEDKVYIDKDLMKLLINLHEMIAQTIKLLKKTYSDPSLEETVDHKEFKQRLSQNNENLKIGTELDDQINRSTLFNDLAKDFIVIDSIPRKLSNELEEYENIKYEDDYNNTTNIKTLTVGVEKNFKLDSNIPKATVVLPDTSDIIPEALESCYLKDVSSGENQPAFSPKEVLAIEQKDEVFDEESQVIAVKFENQETCCELDTQVKDHNTCNDEISMLIDMYRDLASTVETIKPKRSKCCLDKPITEHKNLSRKSQSEILECLKELDQIKELLQKMGNPNLSLDAEENSAKHHCCSYMEYPHVHARLNSVPVILKLNQSSIDILLVNKETHKCKCSNNVKSLGGQNQQVWQLNLNSLNKKLGLPISEFHFEMNDSRFNFKSLDEKETDMSSLNLSGRSEEIYNTNDTLSKSKESLMLLNKLLVLRQDYIGGGIPEYFDVYYNEDSNSALPYSVNKKSLPNMNICSPMDISIKSLTKRCTNEVSHQHRLVNAQLNALGIDNLIRASLPAKCCRKAVINEEQADHKPFSASIKSLPLTISDMQIISEVVGDDDNRMRVSQTITNSNGFEHYTNFQANLGDKIDYFIQRNRVFEVMFFEIFKQKSNETPPRVHPRDSKISQILKRLIYFEDNVVYPTEKVYDKKTGDLRVSKRRHNKKCQINYNVDKTVTFKDKSHYYNGENNIRDKDDKEHYSYKCSYKNAQNVPVDESPRKHRKQKRPSTAPAGPTQSVYISNSNCILSTIYEAEERQKLNHQKENQKANILCLPNKSSITLKNSNKIKEHKESWYYDYSGSDEHNNAIAKLSQKFVDPKLGETILKKKNTKCTSQIPRLIKENYISDTSSNHSAHINTRKSNETSKKSTFNSNQYCFIAKTNEAKYNQEKNADEIGRTKKLKKSTDNFKKAYCDSKVNSDCRKVLYSHLWGNEANLLDFQNMSNIRKTKDVKSSNNLEKIRDFTNSVENLQNPSNSLESTQRIEQSGPGYITVLRPSCGCPQVSIFIPCYCKNLGCESEQLNAKDNKKIVYSESCKKIILPKSCRVNSERDYPESNDEEHNVNEWIQSLTESEI